MTVYVETNFPVEIALAQEQAVAAERILEFGESARTQLAIPSFSIGEAFSLTRHRAIHRSAMIDEIGRHSRELRRSALQRVLAAQMQTTLEALRRLAGDEMNRLEGTIERLLSCTRVLGMDASLCIIARDYQARYGLRLQDALVLATVMADLRTRDVSEPKCFTSRDNKAFVDPEIQAELQTYGARFIGKFEDAVRYIEANT